jgi:hypothetical protein
LEGKKKTDRKVKRETNERKVDEEKKTKRDMYNAFEGLCITSCNACIASSILHAALYSVMIIV